MDKKPTHYLVVRSPYAEALVLGIKSAEFRSWSDRLAGKTVAIAVAKNKATFQHVDAEADFWEATDHERASLRKLVYSGCQGKIIGHVQLGEATMFEWPCESYGNMVDGCALWPKSEWIDSPGGLGLRPLPAI